MVKMDESCRLCGSEEGIRISIFEPGSEYVRKIHKILPITINEYDPLPKTMCHRCSFKVSEFFEFRSVCIKAQEVFKSKLPWLKQKQFSRTDISNPPMVEVCMKSINCISPNEKLLACGSTNVDENNPMIIIDDDSPPFREESCWAEAFPCESETQNKTIVNIKRATGTRKARCIWGTKKRKKKPQKPCKIAEVFTTNMDDFQGLDAIEDDPLCISSDNNTEKKEDFAHQIHNSQTEIRKKGNESLKNEKEIENITMPNHILVTNIPRVGLVYTCEKCARTFLSSQPASLHICDYQEDNKDIISQEDKNDLPLKSVSFHKCDECSKVFSRKSQLISHEKTHMAKDSSSDETFTPTNQRKKNLTRGRPKSTLLSGKTSLFDNVNHKETEITRHSLLSSDSG